MSLRVQEHLSGRSGRVRLLVSDRGGGHSRPPYDGANLGGHVGDDVQAVAANRDDLAALVGVARRDLVFMDQVHGGDVAVVEAARSADTAPSPDADALVTRDPDLALVVLVADCVPVLLADPDAGVIGVAHCGRPGLVPVWSPMR